MSTQKDVIARIIHDAQFGHTDDEPMTWPPHIYKAADTILANAECDLQEAVTFLRDRGKWARSEHGPYVVKTGYDTDGWGHAAQDVDEWYADWLEQFPYREEPTR